MTVFLIITSTEDIASMNIRDKFLNSSEYVFKESDYLWHINPLFKVESIVDTNKKDLLKENEIYLGMTDTPLIH